MVDFKVRKKQKNKPGPKPKPKEYVRRSIRLTRDELKSLDESREFLANYDKNDMLSRSEYLVWVMRSCLDNPEILKKLKKEAIEDHLAKPKPKPKPKPNRDVFITIQVPIDIAKRTDEVLKDINQTIKAEKNKLTSVSLD